MFNPTVLEKLKELNIRSITNTLNEAKNIQPLIRLPINVGSPYFFVTLYDDTLSDRLIRNHLSIGYIRINGVTNMILYVKESEKQKEFNSRLNKENSNFMITNTLTLNYTDKISIFHKPFGKKKEIKVPAQTSILDEFAELSKKPSNLFYSDYAKKHPCFYFYKSSLEDLNNNFKDYKFFKLYCTLLYIAEKSNILKHKRNLCHIYIKDLTAIIPKCFKYIRSKNKTSNSKEKKTYSKSYITFLNIAINAGMIQKYQVIEDCIAITFTDSFISGLSTPPYIKIPFELLEKISLNNYKFILFFITKQFSNNPQRPFFINIKIKELLKITNIKLNTSNVMAAERLNNYLHILEEYHAIHSKITYVADDIKANKLLRFRLYQFKPSRIEIEDNEDDEYYYEE